MSVYFSLVATVSTHSRPKAAGQESKEPPEINGVSTHSRPKAAGQFGFGNVVEEPAVSTHSRPKAAGLTRTQNFRTAMFQHTAARRRLVVIFG